VKERARIIRMKRIKAAAGLRAPHNALRHSFASYHLAMWQDASKTAFELGHARPDMLYRHYRNLVTKEAAEAYWALTPDKITRPRRTTAKKSAS
jgi:integrase